MLDGKHKYTNMEQICLESSKAFHKVYRVMICHEMRDLSIVRKPEEWLNNLPKCRSPAVTENGSLSKVILLIVAAYSNKSPARDSSTFISYAG